MLRSCDRFARRPSGAEGAWGYTTEHPPPLPPWQRTVASLLWEPAGKDNSVSWADEETLALGELRVQLFIEEDGFKRKTQGKAL